MSERYNDGVLDEKFADITRRVEGTMRAIEKSERDILKEMALQFEAKMNVLADIKADGAETRTQATNTNGKVADIIKKQERQKGINVAIATVFIAVVVPAFGWLFLQVFQNSNHVSALYATIQQMEKQISSSSS